MARLVLASPVPWRRRMPSRITRSLVVAVVFTGCLSAQITGDIKGTVADASGSSVPSTQVTITQKQTGETRKQTADTEGRFAFNQLKIGTYTLKAEAAGFRTEVTEAQVRAGE